MHRLVYNIITSNQSDEFIGMLNLISCQVAPVSHMVILTCEVLLSKRCWSIPSAGQVAHAHPRDGSWGSYPLRGNRNIHLNYRS